MMEKVLRILLIIILILIPLVFYKSFTKRKEKKEERSIPLLHRETLSPKPEIALIFDDLGQNFKDLDEIHSLNIPVTVAVIPGLKFSKDVAYLANRYGFSVLIHLPMEPKGKGKYGTQEIKFISASLTKRKLNSLLRYYLNSIRTAIGVNNHLGSKATEDQELMRAVLKAVKSNNLIFIDSRTSLDSCACEVAKQEEVLCGENEGFLDSVDVIESIKDKLNVLLQKASQKGKIIVIAHPKKDTFTVLKERLPSLKKKVKFITLKDYFGL